jgi:hypothetical protein
LPRVSGIEGTPKTSFPRVVFGDNFVERMDWLNRAQRPAIGAGRVSSAAGFGRDSQPTASR